MYKRQDQKGLGGIEYALDNRITSQGSRMLVLADAHRHAMDSSDQAPAAVGNVVLTLDQNIQYIACLLYTSCSIFASSEISAIQIAKRA